MNVPLPDRIGWPTCGQRSRNHSLLFGLLPVLVVLGCGPGGQAPIPLEARLMMSAAEVVRGLTGEEIDSVSCRQATQDLASGDPESTSCDLTMKDGRIVKAVNERVGARRLWVASDPAAEKELRPTIDRFFDLWNSADMAGIAELTTENLRSAFPTHLIASELDCRRNTLGSLVQINRLSGTIMSPSPDATTNVVSVHASFENESGWILLKMHKSDDWRHMEVPFVLAASEMGPWLGVDDPRAAAIEDFAETLIDKWNQRQFQDLFQHLTPTWQRLMGGNETFGQSAVNVYDQIGPVEDAQMASFSPSDKHEPVWYFVPRTEADEPSGLIPALALTARRCGDSWIADPFLFTGTATIQDAEVEKLALESLVADHGYPEQTKVSCELIGQRVVPGREVTCGVTANQLETKKFRYVDLEGGMVWIE